MSIINKEEVKKDIKNFLNIDVINNTTLFGVYIVDINSYELEYCNEFVKSLMFNSNAKYCWEIIYGLDSPCPWCNISKLVDENGKSNNKTVTYEQFNENNDKWYQIQEQVINANDNLIVKNTFLVDISLQKEAQGKLIKNSVVLSLQKEELKKMQSELKELSLRDPLTNLFNRRYLSEISKELLLLSQRENQPLCVLMIDIDKFKNINDSYGHDIGDIVIKKLAETLESSFRQSDILSRLGGEEFAVILPNSKIDESKQLAEDLRKKIEELNILVNNDNFINFTVSIGVSEYKMNDEDSFGKVLKRADEGLYFAKENGRNQVVIK